MSVSLECRGFSPDTKNCVVNLNVSQLDVWLAIITIGAQRYQDVLFMGWQNFFHRFGIGIAALAFLEEKSAGLCLSDVHDKLDGSEKGANSFWYGMAFAKLVAALHLDVPWLANVDAMIAAEVIVIERDLDAKKRGKQERGDFVGRGRNGDWHVLEAKRGRCQPRLMM